jgi:Tfp pilus assembly protein PilE
MTTRAGAFYTQMGMAGFSLIDLLICIAIVTILSLIAVPLHLQSVEKATTVEAKVALAEVVRLEQLYYANNGSYTGNLQELGFNFYSPLKYTELFVQARQDAQGWSYMALALPLGGSSDGDLWSVARNASGQATSPSSLSTSLKGGGSPCSFWSGWGSMEGGQIEGEERITSGGSSGGGGSPCGSKRVVNHGKK